MTDLLGIKPLAVLQTTMIPATNKRGLAIWALSPAFVNREGLGRQFVRDERVVAEQWSVAQQPVLQDHDMRLALLEVYSPTIRDIGDERTARKDADALNGAAIADERTGRLAGQQILAAELAAAKARIAVLEAKPVPTFQEERGQVATVALILGASTDLPVTWSAPFPDTNYRVLPSLCSAVSIAKTEITVKSRTTTGCVLTVKAAGVALAAGQVIDVIAYRFTA